MLFRCGRKGTWSGADGSSKSLCPENDDELYEFVSDDSGKPEVVPSDSGCFGAAVGSGEGERLNEVQLMFDGVGDVGRSTSGLCASKLGFFRRKCFSMSSKVTGLPKLLALMCRSRALVSLILRSTCSRSRSCSCKVSLAHIHKHGPYLVVLRELPLSNSGLALLHAVGSQCLCAQKDRIATHVVVKS